MNNNICPITIDFNFQTTTRMIGNCFTPLLQVPIVWSNSNISKESNWICITHVSIFELCKNFDWWHYMIDVLMNTSSSNYISILSWIMKFWTYTFQSIFHCCPKYSSNWVYWCAPFVSCPLMIIMANSSCSTCIVGLDFLCLKLVKLLHVVD
jgi:hypothetical protein